MGKKDASTKDGRIPARQRTLSNTPSVIARTLSSAAASLSVRPRTARNDDTPPADLLDDDPFANLSYHSSPIESSFVSFPEYAPSTSITPRPLAALPASPLASSPDSSSSFPRQRLRSMSSTPSFTPSPPFMASASVVHAATVRRHVQPAYTRPAFNSRPSLPSLRTLSQSDLPMPPVRVRSSHSTSSHRVSISFLTHVSIIRYAREL